MGPEEQVALLQRFEPIIHYTKGELFLPMAVEDYVGGAALVDDRGAKRTVRVDHGDLTIDRLAEVARENPGARLALERVDEPLDRKQFRAWRRREDRPGFQPSSRFAVVGLLSRLIDSVMRLTLLLRGRVPGGFTAASQLAYAETPARSVYYGRVVRDGGYIVCQYWYFYAMNDWRSTFGGVNDHEADWEQVTIFLVEEDDRIRPAWVAFSSHDEVGDDLRRRWDDPDMTRVGEHPVVYAGAGSHSGAYLPGEYVISTSLPLPGWLGGLRSAWTKIRPWARDEDTSVLSIPYIDYHRGDGPRVGVDGDRPFHPIVIDDDTPWVRDFRGLWGLDTSDPLGGERAPAGPRYERSGIVRESWGQPVAWAGLDKEPPTAREARARLMASRERVAIELAELEVELDLQRERLRGARAAERALGRSPRKHTPLRDELQAEVTRLRTRQRELGAFVEGVDAALVRPEVVDDVHAHLTHRAMPINEETIPRGRILRFWTAASTAILLGALGVLLLVEGISTVGILEIAGIMLIIEAILRRRLVALIAGLVVIAVALVGVWAVVLLLAGNLSDALGIALLFAAFYLALSTVREGIRTR